MNGCTFDERIWIIPRFDFFGIQEPSVDIVFDDLIVRRIIYRHDETVVPHGLKETQAKALVLTHNNDNIMLLV